jgi:hypothetical protein
MPLKVEVIGFGDPPSDCAFAGLDRDDLLEQPHRGLVRQAVNQRHRE